MAERRPSEIRYDITITVNLPNRDEPRVEMAYRGVPRADAMAQPALAAAVTMFEESEPVPATAPKVVESRVRDIHQHRRFPRHNLRLPITVTPLASEQAVPGESLVVGEGGIGATLTEELAESEVVTIEIGGETAGQPLRIRGTVRNRTGTRYGLAFFALSEQERAQLRHILRRGGQALSL